MATTTNNLTANLDTNHQDHNNREMSIMESVTNNISSRVLLPNILGIRSAAKVVVTLAVGAALLMAATLPGVAMADGPNRPVSSNTSSALLNDDFSMVFGIPDVGLNLGGATSTPAKVKTAKASGLFNDDFSMVYGTPDIGLNLGGSASTPSKVKTAGMSGPFNDDFSMVYGIPDINGWQNHASVSVVHMTAWDSGDPLD